MKKSIWALAVLVLATAGCNRQGNKKATTEETTPPTEVAAAIAAPAEGTLPVAFANNEAKVTISKTEGQQVELELAVPTAGMLEGLIYSPDDTANVRFTQIILPDGTADGPFGPTLEYEVPQGTTRLRIGENMMAGDPWAGEFTVELTLK